MDAKETHGQPWKPLLREPLRPPPPQIPNSSLPHSFPAALTSSSSCWTGLMTTPTCACPATCWRCTQVGASFVRSCSHSFSRVTCLSDPLMLSQAQDVCVLLLYFLTPRICVSNVLRTPPPTTQAGLTQPRSGCSSRTAATASGSRPCPCQHLLGWRVIQGEPQQPLPHEPHSFLVLQLARIMIYAAQSAIGGGLAFDSAMVCNVLFRGMWPHVAHHDHLPAGLAAAGPSRRCWP